MIAATAPWLPPLIMKGRHRMLKCIVELGNPQCFPGAFPRARNSDSVVEAAVMVWGAGCPTDRSSQHHDGKATDGLLVVNASAVAGIGIGLHAEVQPALTMMGLRIPCTRTKLNTPTTSGMQIRKAFQSNKPVFFGGFVGVLGQLVDHEYGLGTSPMGNV